MRESLPKTTLIFPRTNSFETGMLDEDINSIATPTTKNMIDGFLIPKLNNAQMVRDVDKSLSKLEAKLGLKKNTYKIIALIETAEAFTKTDEIFTGTSRPSTTHLYYLDYEERLRSKPSFIYS